MNKQQEEHKKVRDQALRILEKESEDIVTVVYGVGVYPKKIKYLKNPIALTEGKRTRLVNEYNRKGEGILYAVHR